MPQNIKNLLLEHQTIACASKDGVYFSETLMAEELLRFYKEELGIKPEDFAQVRRMEYDRWSDIKNTISNVLKHELGHILHGHIFMAYPNNELDMAAQTYTNEIETNRGIKEKEQSKWFKFTCLSDDKDPFKSTKPFISHTGIFRQVKTILKENQNGGSNGGNSNKGGKSNKNKFQQTQNSAPTSSSGQKDGKSTNSMPKPPKNDVITSEREQHDNQQDAIDQLAAELGVKPSKAMSDDDRTTEQRLEAITEAFRDKEIARTIGKVKGYLKGELCKTKVKTYSRQSRHQEGDLMLKGVKRGKNAKPRILVALDCSGSMSSTATKTAVFAVQSVMKTIGRNRSDVSICIFNTRVLEHGKAKDMDKVVSKFHGHGGTDFSAPINLAVEQSCDIVLAVGDGCDSVGYGITPAVAQKLKEKPLKWVDVLIQGESTPDYMKNVSLQNTSNGLVERETYFLGSDKNKIERQLERL